MDLKDSRYSEELGTAVEAAEQAGEIIDRCQRNGFEDWDKEDGSKVTEADIKSQEKIVETISEKFPGDGFLGEEEDLEPESEERVWIVDPIDGTFNFDRGFPYYCVSIALKVGDEVKIGVVHSPESSLGETFFAARNEGSFVKEAAENLRDAEELSVSSHEAIEESIFFHTLFDIFEGELEKEAESIKEFSRRKATHRQLGACALEMCFVASGRADFIVNPLPKPWDYSAGKIIVEEAGGKVEVRGSEFPDAEEVIASNGELQEKVVETVGDRFQ